MKLRLPNKLIAAIVAAASPVLFSTLSTATLCQQAAAANIDDALLSFSSANPNGTLPTGWTLSGGTLQNGVLTTQSGPTYITPVGGITRNAGSNRYVWSAVFTVNKSALSSNDGKLLQALVNSTGDNGTIGIGVKDGNVVGTWNGGGEYGSISVSSIQDNGDGTVTLGIAFRDGNNGTRIASTTANSGHTGLRGDKIATHIGFSSNQGVTYSNLYWFADNLSDDDLNWAIKEASAAKVFYWVADGESANWTGTNWTLDRGATKTDFSQFTTTTDEEGVQHQRKNSVVLNAAEGAHTINVNAVTLSGSMRVSGEQAYTLNMTGTSPSSFMDVKVESGSSLTIDGTGDAIIGKVGSTAGSLSGSGSLIKNGTGTLTLSAGNHAFAGNLTVNAGTLKVDHIYALGANNTGDSSRTISINSGATLDVNGYEGETDTHYVVTLHGGTLTNTGTERGSGSRQFVRNLVLTDNSTVHAVSGHAFGIIGAGYAATSIALNGHTLEKTGDGTYYLTNTDVTGNGTLKVTAGSLQFADNGADIGTFAADIELAGGSVGGSIHLADDASITVSKDGSEFSAAVDTAGHKLTVGGTSNVTLSGAVSGAGSIAKSGSNTVTLSGNMGNFSGDVEVGAGTLNLNGAGEVSMKTLTMSAGNLNYGGGGSLTTTGAALTGGAISVTGSGALAINGTQAMSLGGLSVTNGGSLSFAGGSVSATSLSLRGQNAQVSFTDMLTVAGSRVDIGYANAATTGAVATFAGGLTVTGRTDNSYALVVGANNKAILGGESSISGYNIGAQTDGEIVIAESATVTANRFFNSAGSNGKLTVEDRASITLTGASTIQKLTNAGTATFNSDSTLNGLENSGTIEVKKGTGGAPTLTLSAAYSNQGSATDPTHTVNLGNVLLDNATLKNNSDCETAVRNITTLTVDGASALTQNSWNTFWNIGALKKGTAEGERTLTWRTTTTHWTNSVLSLNGAGDFDGTLHAERAYVPGVNDQPNGQYQGYVEINHADALKNAVLETQGKVDNAGNVTSYMTVALNSDTVNLAGLRGDEYSILIAGEANKTIGSGSNRQGQVVPTSTDTSELIITGKENSDDTFAGKVESGISITHKGEGTQTFSGDVSSFDGQLTATSGILKIADATPMDGNVSTIATTGLHANGGIIASEGGAIVKITNEAGGGQLTIGANGGFSVAGTGKLIVSPWWDFNMTALREDGTATMKATGDVANYAFSREDITISDAKVSYTAANGNPTVKHKFTNSTIVAAGSRSVLTVTNSANTLVGVDAEGGAITVQNAANSAGTLKSIVANGGNVTIQGLGESATVNLTELTIAGSKTVSAYTGTPTDEQIAAAQNGSNMAVEATLSISNGTLTAGSGAKLNAHLSLGNNTTLNIADATVGGAGLTMGSSVTIEQGAKVKLSDNIISGLNSLTVGSGLTLFSGVDSFNLGVDAYNAANTYTASDYFNLAGVNIPSDFVIKYYGTGIAAMSDGTDQFGQSIFIWREMPEPATSTLSLLALAALAARRKRK